jgi:type II secretory pathway component PulF
MPSYRYRAARPDGALVSGLVESASAVQAGAVLTERGLYPVAVDPAHPWEMRRRPAGRRDLAVVFRSVAALVAAGVPLERAIVSSEGLTRGRLRECLANARAQLREGRGLAEAMDSAHGTVPSVVIGMLRAGERGSLLGQTLEQVATHLEQEADLVARVRQALAYPLLLAAAGTASVIVIATVVVPRFAELLGDLGQNLPPATRLLLDCSQFVSSHALALCLGLGGTIAVLAAYVRRPAGTLRKDRILLGVPMIGPIRHALATARLSRALGGMLLAGMPLLPALEAAREAADDTAVGQRVSAAGSRVAQGQTLTSALEHTAAVSPSAAQLYAVGESSGRLAVMVLRAGDLAAQEAERGLKTLVALLEPGLVVVFGGLVAFVAAALLQAVYSIRPGGV